MNRTGRIALSILVSWIVPLAIVTLRVAAQDGPKTTPDASPLDMSKAVACQSVRGYEQFVALPGASLTSEDKLLVYYRPLHFKVEPVEKPKPGHRYRARLIQDGQIRRKGEKTVLMKKENLLDYDPTFEEPVTPIFLTNTVGLKGLAPGEYEFDIILRDALAPGVSATQPLAFTVIPTPKAVPTPKNEGPGEPEDPPGPSVETKARAKKTKKARKDGSQAAGFGLGAAMALGLSPAGT